MDITRWLKCQWDRAGAVVVATLGLLALWLGWMGVSGKSLPSEQIPYLASGGLVGLFALGVAATLWLSADMRDEWRKLDDIYRRMEHKPDEGASMEQAEPTRPRLEAADSPAGLDFRSGASHAGSASHGA